MANDKTEEDVIVHMFDAEYQVDNANNDIDNAEFEELVGMFDNVRVDKKSQWISNLSIAEFQGHIQRHAADAANISFSRTEFVNVDLQKHDEQSLASAEAAKETINNTLSRTDLHYFQKFLRLVQTKDICGRNYIRCWWDFETKKGTRIVELPSDPDGNPVTREEEIDIIIKDQFDFEVIDPRNICYSSEYVYDFSDKNRIFLRFDTTLNDLEAKKDMMGYFNLDKIDTVLSGDTDTKKNIYQSDNKQDPGISPVKNLMVVERYGKDWVMVDKRDEDGDVIEISSGYDSLGNKKEGAVLLEVIRSVAYTGKERVLIRHQVNPYKDAKGRHYKPLARGLCYIHPTRDRGFGDGQASKDLQTGLNDTFNANNDNTLLGLMKVFKVNKFTVEDGMPLDIYPGAMLQHEGNPNDIEIVDFPSNTQSALNQMFFLERKLQEMNASDPAIPVNVSATATAEARAEKKMTSRSNYKNLVHEKTLLEKLYWFILQMTEQFMQPETALKVMGPEHIENFNPDLDYIYHPVSEALDTDASRGAKIDRLNTTLGYVVNSQNPNAAATANKILSKIFKLMGDEEQNAVAGLFDTESPIDGQGIQPGGDSPVQSPVNQSGLPQPTQEASQIGGI